MDRDQRKALLLHQLQAIEKGAASLRDQLRAIEQEEEEKERLTENKYVYVIKAHITGGNGYASYSSADAAYNTLEEAQKELPDRRYGSNNTVNFQIVKLEIGNKTKHEIESGYYSD
jgi:hypothetical protein